MGGRIDLASCRAAGLRASKRGEWRRSASMYSYRVPCAAEVLEGVSKYQRLALGDSATRETWGHVQAADSLHSIMTMPRPTACAHRASRTNQVTAIPSEPRRATQTGFSRVFIGDLRPKQVAVQVACISEVHNYSMQLYYSSGCRNEPELPTVVLRVHLLPTNLI